MKHFAVWFALSPSARLRDYPTYDAKKIAETLREQATKK